MPIKYDTLHKFYVTRSSARELFDAIVNAGVEDGRTTVDEVIEASGATRRQAITLLRDLDQASCGEFKVGRKGHPSRLVWRVDPRELVRRVIGRGQGSAASVEQAEQQIQVPAGSTATKPGPLDGLARDTTNHREPRAGSSAGLREIDTPAPTARERNTKVKAKHDGETHADHNRIEHSYVLRPDSRVSVTLPTDLTRREAEVLADWVRNLSFER